MTKVIDKADKLLKQRAHNTQVTLTAIQAAESAHLQLAAVDQRIAFLSIDV